MDRVARAAVAVAAVGMLAACGDSGGQASPAFPPAAKSAAASSPLPSAVATDDWVTYHHDNGRSGAGAAQPAATTLTRSWQADLDGAVYGEPLVLGDRVFAATENDTVYGLDAASGATLWTRHVGTPVPKSKLPCGNIDPLG